MTENDKKAFLAVMYKLFAIYEMPLENKHLLSAWFDALSDYDIEEVAVAAQRYIKSPDFGTYKPKPADLIKMIEGTSADRALMAWSKVESAVRSIGTYVTVAFDDPIIHRVIADMGGWVALGEKSEDELPFVAKEFGNRYRGLAQKQETPAHPRKLYGVIDTSNGATGHVEEMAPVLIGDRDKAGSILAGELIGDNTLRKLLN